MSRLFVLFIIVLNFEANADSESENNNSEATADILSPGIAMVGRLSNNEDWDYFKLDIGSTETFSLRFASPYSENSTNQWLVAIQEPRDSYIVFQEALSPTAGEPVERKIETKDNGTYIIFVAPVLGSSSVPSTEYTLTITPENFQAALGSYDGLWQDDLKSSFYSLHESLDGLLYIELQQGGAAWKAYYGARNGNKATLNQVVGPGSATLELTFISTVKVEARYKSCRTLSDDICDANGALLYTGSLIFPK